MRTILTTCLTLLTLAVVPPWLQAQTPPARDAVMPFLEANCLRCHGAKKQKGKFSLHNVAFDFANPVTADLWLRISRQLASKEMPPPEEDEQPSASERARITDWIEQQLVAAGQSKAYFEKLLNPAYGNYVSHERLFSGEVKTLPYSPSRIWRFSPELFKGKFISGAQSPFSQITSETGIRDYSATGGVDQSTIQTILINTDQYLYLRRDEPVFQLFAKDEPVPDDKLAQAVGAEFKRALGRNPDEAEIAKYLAFLKKNIADGGQLEGLKTTIKAMFLCSESIFRMEFGLGKVDEQGRRHLSPDELAYAVAYALTDQRPERNDVIRKAVQKGKLTNKEEVAAVVRETLDLGINPSKTPRVIRFFEEYFGYQRANGVFKDMNRVEAEGIQQWNTNRLTYEAQQLVEYFVNRDKDVIQELLTSNRFYIAHPGDNKLAKAYYDEAIREDYVELKVQQLLEQYKLQKRDPNAAQEREEIENTRKQAEARQKTVRQAIKDGLTPFPGWPYNREIRGQGDLIYIDVYNLPATHQTQRQQWNWVIDQPMEMPREQRAGILTHPAWLAAHSLNDGNDPVRRGRWVQEKLLAGVILDVPPDVDASVSHDPRKTLRERMEPLREAQCSRCHNKMNPLGEPFEMFDDWGRFRAEFFFDEKAEIVLRRGPEFEKLLAAGKMTRRAVDATGEIRGSGDPTVDGKVQNAVEMMQRLGRSERARQTFIRYLFRYFMGRNEMLSDSQTLIEAEKVYLQNGGSFKALVVSLLSSDSFLYRR